MALTRRRAVIGAAGAAMMGTAAGARGAAGTGPATVRLRVLETSVLHMFALDYDYSRGRQDDTVGLDKVATLVGRARAEAPNTLLFDNGDILQGNPLGDYVALREAAPSKAAGRVHPMFRAMNTLGYDAATLGNHEFNYGLPFLEASLPGAAFPFVCANVQRADGSAFLPPFVVTSKRVVAEDGSVHVLRVGVLGLVTPQIMVWDHAHLAGRLEAGDIVEAARRVVPELRRRCDLVVALCHSGISGAKRQGGDENAALYLAEVGGIDLILTGHEHKVFPGPFFAGEGAGVDAALGTLHGVPAVMPGFWGSHLGVADLLLERAGGMGAPWRVASFAVEARPIYARRGLEVESLAAPAPGIAQAVAPEHAGTLRWMEEPVGRFTAPVTSYFALAGSDASLSLVNAAQLDYATPLLRKEGLGDLPLLSAAAPFKAGGSGPDSFVDIAAGPVTMRDVANLYMFSNTVCAVRCTGAELRDWLEKSASLFRRVDPRAEGPQELVGTAIPSFDFDVIAGVTWRIDLSRPARFDGEGRLTPEAKAGAERRVVGLAHEGQPVADGQEFLVVTNNYRAGGGGHFAGTGGGHVVWQAPDANRDVLMRYVRARETVVPAVTPTWSFAPLGREVVLAFDSGPAAARLLGAHPGIAALPGGRNGYARYGLTLSA